MVLVLILLLKHHSVNLESSSWLQGDQGEAALKSKGITSLQMLKGEGNIIHLLLRQDHHHLLKFKVQLVKKEVQNL